MPILTKEREEETWQEFRSLALQFRIRQIHHERIKYVLACVEVTYPSNEANRTWLMTPFAKYVVEKWQMSSIIRGAIGLLFISTGWNFLNIQKHSDESLSTKTSLSSSKSLNMQNRFYFIFFNVQGIFINYIFLLLSCTWIYLYL